MLKAVAAGLNRNWGVSVARAHFVGDYYRATRTTYIDALKARGLNASQIGTHAGSADTSLSMAIVPSLVKPEWFAQAALAGSAGRSGGHPRPSSPALGQIGVEMVVEQTVAAIRRGVAAAR